VRHGEAVAIGIALDVTYSHMVGLLERSKMEWILQCFRRLGLETLHPSILNDSKTGINPLILDGLEEFREHLGGPLTIMLLEDIGKGTEVHHMDPDILSAATQELLLLSLAKA